MRGVSQDILACFHAGMPGGVHILKVLPNVIFPVQPMSKLCLGTSLVFAVLLSNSPQGDLQVIVWEFTSPHCRDSLPYNLQECFSMSVIYHWFAIPNETFSCGLKKSFTFPSLL